MDELVRRHDDAAAKALDESSKCDAILARLPPPMLEKVQLESDLDAESYAELRKWVESRLSTAVAGVTYAALSSNNSMDIGGVGADPLTGGGDAWMNALLKNRQGTPASAPPPCAPRHVHPEPSFPGPRARQNQATIERSS